MRADEIPRRRRTAPNPSQARVAYLGRRHIRVRGTYTGEEYVFSPNDRIRWVDSDDSRVLLRTRFFRRVET